jgi:hypothetical protein
MISGPKFCARKSTPSSAEANGCASTVAVALHWHADVREELADVVRVAPQQRRLGERRRWRGVLGHQPEHLGGRAVGHPVAQADPAVGADDTCELVGNHLVPRCEHHAERRQHDVERPVREGQIFGVALDPLDGHAGCLRVRAPCVEELGGEIDPDRPPAGTRGADRGVAASACDVQHVLALADREVLHQPLAHRPKGPTRHRVEVACSPACSGALLCLAEARNRCGSPGDPPIVGYGRRYEAWVRVS